MSIPAEPTPLRPARLLDGSGARLEALYPQRRVVVPNELEAAELLAAARAEADSLRLQAQELVTQARNSARKIVTDARRAAKSKLEHARDEGRHEGAESFAAALVEVERTMESLRRQAGLDARRLAVRFAKAVLDVEFSVAPERVLDLVESLLRRAGNPPQLEVRLHPSDAVLVRQRVTTLRERAGLTGQIRVLDDDAVPEHNVRVESRAGVWEAGIEIQLAPLVERLSALDRGAAQERGEGIS